MPNQAFTFTIYTSNDELLKVTVGKARLAGEAIEYAKKYEQYLPNHADAQELADQINPGDKFLLDPPVTLVPPAKNTCLRIDSQGVSTGYDGLGIWRNIHIQNGKNISDQMSFAIVKIMQGAQLCYAVHYEFNLRSNLISGLIHSRAERQKYVIPVKIERKKRRDKVWAEVSLKSKEIQKYRTDIEERLKKKEDLKTKKMQFLINLHKIAKKSTMIEHVMSTIGKNTLKMSEKEVPHIAAKKIPLLSFGMGIYFGISRLTDGDYVGAIAEVASGAIADIPGIGTAASTAIDAGLLLKDIKEAENNTKMYTKLEEDEIKTLQKANEDIKREIEKIEVEELVHDSEIFGEGHSDSFYDESEASYCDDISKIHIQATDFIIGIQVEYGISGKNDKHGTLDCAQKTMVLETNERITKVEVSTHCGAVSSLTFYTDFVREESFGQVRADIQTYELVNGAYLAAVKGYNMFKASNGEATTICPSISGDRELIPAIGFTAKF